MGLFKDLLGSKTDKSHKRAVVLVFAAVIAIVTFIVLWVEIPANNIEILKLIIGLMSTVIIGQSGLSVLEKFRKTDKKENNTENIE